MNKEIPKPENLKAVYCYYFPETRRIITEVTRNYPHDIYLQSLKPGLEDYHKPVVIEYLKTFKNQLPGLEYYPFQYVTAGASEGIFHLLARIAAFEPETPLYILQGEYEGYQGYGGNLGLKFQIVTPEQKVEDLKPGIFFVSNPSARDGNIIPNEEIIKIGEAGHRINLDVTYVGLTEPHEFMVTHPSIESVVVSLSKPYGLYYYRFGFLFSKKEYKTLEVNKWFKNVLTLEISRQALTRLKSSELAAIHRPTQKLALTKLKEDFGVTAFPSDVLLLAHAETAPETLEICNRKSNYRFCLTPYFLIQERGHI